MVGSILSNIKVSNRNFKLINGEIQNMSNKEGFDVEKDYDVDKMNYEDVLKKIKEFALLDNEGQNLETKYSKQNVKCIVVKAFSINPNINGYGVIATEKQKELELGIKVIKTLYKDATIKFAIDGSDKILSSAIGTLGQVVKVDSKLDLYNNKLIAKVFGKEANQDEAIVEDLLSLIYIGKSFEDGAKPKEVYLTVHGGAIDGNKVISVNEGATYNEIFTELNGKEELLKKVIANGSLNGKSKFNMDENVNHSIRSILFLTEKDSPSKDEISCIRCSKCLRVCPEGLNPIKLKELWDRKEKEEFLKFGGEKCIECGLCSYVCPSNIEIAQAIKTGKVFNK